MLVRDFGTLGVQVIDRLSDFRSCPISPCNRLNPPVIRKASGNSVTLLGEIMVDGGLAMIHAFDYLSTRRRRVLAHRRLECLAYMRDVRRRESAA